MKETPSVPTLHERRHILALGGKRYLLHNPYSAPNRLIILSSCIEPKQKRAFGRVSDRLRVFAAQVEPGSGIYGYPLLDHFVSRIAEEVRMSHLHTVLGKGSGLVGAYHRSGSHRLASVQFADEIVGAEHPAHGIGKGKRNRHRQTFGNGNHNQGDGNHERLQEIRKERNPSKVHIGEIQKHPAYDYHDRHCITHA